ncbi:MAG: IclR family transcriptional regulator, partial [Nocardioidaceae bacterium]|nr:IclR family transcriptional regulator [Nocardioidaceae bacterium]
LTALAAEDLTERDIASGRWHLGSECFLLGAAATNRHDVTPVARTIVRRLAAETGESAFFSARRGDETVCVLREDGRFPIRSHVLHEGIRVPLGVASAGLAVLALLPERERESYLSTADLAAEFGADHGPEPLTERVRATRERGFAVNPGLIVEGSWGLGAAVLDGRDVPRWAVSLTGIEARLKPRQEELGQLLLRAAHELSTQVARSTLQR